MGKRRSVAGYFAGKLAPQILDLTSAVLPSDFTFARASTATYRDSSGALQLAASGVRRVAYNLAGELLGTVIEPAATNKAATVNANPDMVVAGWTKSGALSTFMGVTDATITADIAAQKLGTICSSGRMMKVDGSGVGSSTITLSATFGSANPHIFSIDCRAEGGNVTISRTQGSGSGAPQSIVVTPADGFSRKAILFTGHVAGDQVTITVPGGAIFRGVLEMLEEITSGSVVGVVLQDALGNPVPTSRIVTTGAAATRAADSLSIQSLASKSYWNEAEGAIVIDCIPRAFSPTVDQQLFSAQEGGSSTQTNILSTKISKVAASDAGYVRRSCTAASQAQTNTATHKPQLGKRYRVALAWKNGMTTLFPQADCLDEALLDGSSAPTRPVNIDRLLIGSWRNGREFFFGHVRSIKIYRKYRSVPQLGPDIWDAGEKAIVYAGQSNAYGHFRAQVDQNNSGESNALAVFDQYYPASHNHLINAATNGSLAYGNSGSGAPYWYDDVLGTLSGAAWKKYADLVQAAINAGVVILFDVWRQGDGGIPWPEKAKYKSTLNLIFDAQKALRAGFLLLIDPLSRYIDTTDNKVTQCVKDVNRELAASRPEAIMGPESAGLPIDDYAHFDDALGYGVHGPRLMRKIMKALGRPVADDVDGPSIASAAISGNSVIVTVAQEAGLSAYDITPSSGEGEGFRVYSTTPENGGSAIVPTSQQRTGVNQITVTFSAAPQPGWTLIFLNGQCFGTALTNAFGSQQDYTKFFRSTSPNGLLLRNARIVL